MAKTCDRSEHNFQQVKAPQPAVQIERSCPQVLGKLPWARQKRTNAPGNVQTQRQDVSGEVLIAWWTQEVASRVRTDGYARQQHNPPECRCPTRSVRQNRSG